MDTQQSHSSNDSITFHLPFGDGADFLCVSCIDLMPFNSSGERQFLVWCGNMAKHLTSYVTQIAVILLFLEFWMVFFSLRASRIWFIGDNLYSRGHRASNCLIILMNRIVVFKHVGISTLCKQKAQPLNICDDKIIVINLSVVIGANGVRQHMFHINNTKSHFSSSNSIFFVQIFSWAGIWSKRLVTLFTFSINIIRFVYWNGYVRNICTKSIFVISVATLHLSRFGLWKSKSICALNWISNPLSIHLNLYEWWFVISEGKLWKNPSKFSVKCNYGEFSRYSMHSLQLHL